MLRDHATSLRVRQVPAGSESGPVSLDSGSDDHGFHGQPATQAGSSPASRCIRHASSRIMILVEPPRRPSPSPLTDPGPGRPRRLIALPPQPYAQALSRRLVTLSDPAATPGPTRTGSDRDRRRRSRGQGGPGAAAARMAGAASCCCGMRAAVKLSGER
jgi:hypothetical protein